MIDRTLSGSPEGRTFFILKIQDKNSCSVTKVTVWNDLHSELCGVKTISETKHTHGGIVLPD